MLVLSRRPQERVVFPQLKIEVEILSVSGNTVRVGVNAPREVLVLRHEVAEKDAAQAAQSATKGPSAKVAPAALPAASVSAVTAPTEAISASRKWIHTLRNHLNTAGLAMQVAQSQMACGDITDADSKLQLALAQLNELEAVLSSGPPTSVGASNVAASNVAASNRPASDIARRSDALPPPAEPVDASADANQAASSRRKPLALVVEDNETESELLASVLRLNGFRVDIASDGCHALDYLATHKRPDVVLLDMRMPRCDGPTTISAIRSNPELNGLRVVAVSGCRSSDVGVSTGPQGVDRWFCKPVDPGRLVHQLQHDLHVSTGANRSARGPSR